MNIIKRRKYVIEFDVWEPTQKLVDTEMDSVVRFAKKELHHAGNLHITLESEARQ